MSGTKADRNAAIVRMHVDDRMTMAAIGEVVELSRERVRQIVRKAGVPSSVTHVVLEENAGTEWECAVCGKSERRLYNEARRATCGDECQQALTRTYTDEDLLTHLRGLSGRLGRTASANDLDAACGPYTTTYRNRFSLLRNAQRLAGLEPNEPGRAPKHPSPEQPETR